MSAPLLELRGVAKRFGTVTALDGVDLEVGAREVVCVLGPTGAGKTTLLRVVAGLERPDAGTVRLAGADAAGRSPAERDVALVFQSFSLYPRWSVRENLAFPLRAPGRALGPGEVAARVAEAARLLRIEPLLDRPARRLSGGEMQRVAIGRALVRRPRLFLLDEPLSNLDAKLREALRAEIADLVRELGTPMLYVTHDQAEAMSMGDRLLVLAAGRVLQSGTPREVYRAPASPEVATLLGQPRINLLRARRVDGLWRLADGTPLGPAAADAPPAALLGIRPEDVAPEGGPAPARVLLVEDLGHARVIAVRLGPAELRLLLPRRGDPAGEPAVRVGDELRPRLDLARLVVWPDPARPGKLDGPGA